MEMTHTAQVAWAGFVIGIVFGIFAQRIEFCLTGGLREWLGEGRPRRAAAFLFAMAVAIAGTQIAAALGWIDPGESLYLQPGFSWLLMPFGGLLFGYGMMVARGCGARALVLLGDGNLRSLVVLLCLGIAAYVTLTGLLARLRLAVLEATTVAPELASPSLASVVQEWGASPGLAVLTSTVLVAGGLAAFAFFRLGLAKTPRDAAGAAVIGGLVPAGWMATGRLGADDFDPVRVESLTFVAPVGDSIQYLMLSTGMQLGFGVAVVGGVLLGSLAASSLTRDFQLRGFETPGDVLRSAGGGILMGIGGALALGCSVGQGMTGVSTLALPSFLAAAGIFAGGVAALRGPLRVAKAA